MLKAHRFAEIFPLLDGPGFDALVADIRQHGQREPVVLFKGEVLDGRNRWRACDAAGVEPETTTFVGTDDEALALVLSSNLHRRHLDESQRAMVAARVANLRWGQKTSDASIEASAVSQPQAAAACNVARSTVQRAAVVLHQGAPELVRAVEAGEVAVSAAAAVARLPKDEQREVVSKGPAAIRERAREARLLTDKNLFGPAPSNDEAVDIYEPDDADVGDDEPAVSVEDDPILPERPKTTPRWGDFELSSAVVDLLGRFRDFRAEVDRMFEAVDPSRRDEFSERVEPALLELFEALRQRLPVTARRAEENRARMRVLDGGK